jgi:hypothetical protein
MTHPRDEHTEWVPELQAEWQLVAALCIIVGFLVAVALLLLL